MKLEINHRKKNEKRTNTWRLNNMLLKNQWVNNEIKTEIRDFPGSTVVKNPPANAGDKGSIPDLGRSHMPWSN